MIRRYELYYHNIIKGPLVNICNWFPEHFPSFGVSYDWLFPRGISTGEKQKSPRLCKIQCLLTWLLNLWILYNREIRF